MPQVPEGTHRHGAWLSLPGLVWLLHVWPDADALLCVLLPQMGGRGTDPTGPQCARATSGNTVAEWNSHLELRSLKEAAKGNLIHNLPQKSPKIPLSPLHQVSRGPGAACVLATQSLPVSKTVCPHPLCCPLLLGPPARQCVHARDACVRVCVP